MRKGLSPAITVRLVIMAVLVAALLVMTNRPALLWVTDAYNWAANKSVPVSGKRQALTALHEAAHVVASATLRGTGSVHSTRVYTQVPRDARDTVYGQSDVDVSIRPDVRADTMNVAVMLYAGGMAEAELLKRQPDSNGSDLKQARRALLLHYPDHYGNTDDDEILLKPKDVLDFMDDTRAAQYCAQSAVQTNGAVVRALGEEILKQPDRMGRRQMDEEQLRTFFASHPVMKPYTVCDF